ncbi:type II secretion system GspH family protein [Acidovorax sp. sic0104]|uniref:type II secretion system GspH family protein n=1 Tax=Acidovorax sp. sic0104 TaxID=2854784 RepID=UPI001C467C26|nr:type II secretion system GspH family protein [Acidovorax sp. sic0104]MBV7542137.1 hypothetical protein [Acidovorax sp. sic0104]
MFTLIIAVISIALVVLLAAATMYYGGESLSEGRVQADAAALMNQAQQITGAIELYVADTNSKDFESFDVLIPNYLTSLPEGWQISGAGNGVQEGFVAFPIGGSDADKLNVCKEVNKKLGIATAPPLCTAVPDNYVGCCTTS